MCKRVVIYARYSTDQQNPASIETQLDLGASFVAERGWKLSISQIEELGLEVFWPRKAELLAELDALAARSGYDLACLMVTDITRNESLLLVSGRREIVDLIEYPVLEPRVFELKGVVSRKKQLFPALSAAVGKALHMAEQSPVN